MLHSRFSTSFDPQVVYAVLDVRKLKAFLCDTSKTVHKATVFCIIILKVESFQIKIYRRSSVYDMPNLQHFVVTSPCPVHLLRKSCSITLTYGVKTAGLNQGHQPFGK